MLIPNSQFHLLLTQFDEMKKCIALMGTRVEALEQGALEVGPIRSKKSKAQGDHNTKVEVRSPPSSS